jgi:hypothetical protein
MGRKSIADQIFDQYSEEDPGDSTWIIVYDFQGVKPTTKFYDNLHRIQSKAEDGQLIQYSVYVTHDRRAAKAVKQLVLHYKGDVTVFRGELADL